MQVTQEVIANRQFTVIRDGKLTIWLNEAKTVEHGHGWFPPGWIFHSRRDAEKLGREDEPGFRRGTDALNYLKASALKRAACRAGLADFGEDFIDADWEECLTSLESDGTGKVVSDGDICIDSGCAEIIPEPILDLTKAACDQRHKALAEIRVPDDGMHRVKLVDGPAHLRPASISKGAANGARVHARCLHWLPAGDYVVADSGCGPSIRHKGGYLKSFMVSRTLYLVAEGLC